MLATYFRVNVSVQCYLRLGGGEANEADNIDCIFFSRFLMVTERIYALDKTRCKYL